MSKEAIINSTEGRNLLLQRFELLLEADSLYGRRYRRQGKKYHRFGGRLKANQHSHYPL